MSFTPKIVEEIIRSHRPKATSITIQPTISGKFNQSYYVQADEEALILRIAPPRQEEFLFYERSMMRQEPQIHALVRAETAVPVPRVLLFDETHTLIDRDYMLMERLPGRPLNDIPANMNHVLPQIGRMLAQVHKLHATRFGYLGPHKPMTPQTTWVDAFAIMWHKLIADIQRVGQYSTREAYQFRKLLDKHLRLFDRPIYPCLLHMDIWAQNILIDDNETITGIIDWDRALWGDPEIEFAVLDYCGISQPAFWQGYGQERDNSPEANIRQIFYLLYELQKYIVIEAGRRHNSAKAQQYKEQVQRTIAEALPAG